MPPTNLPGLLLDSSPQDEEKRMQQELQLEEELRTMRREFVILDQDRTRTQLIGMKKSSKNDKVFGIFKQEYINVMKDLAIATAPEKKRGDDKMFERLNLYIQHYEIYNNAVASEKTYMVELEEQIKKVKKSVDYLREQQITDRQVEERHSLAVHTCETLENKLEVQIKKFNVICAKNSAMRVEIDHLLWDRQNFMTLWDRLIQKLSNGKKIMLDLIEQATVAYDQREIWCERLQVLRMQAHNDLFINIEKMQRMKRKGDQAKKLEKFYIIKGQKRIMKDLIAKKKQKRATLKEKLQQKISNFENMMLDIYEFTKEKKADVIAKKFYNDEAANFTCFRYINDMIEDMENEGDRLGYLHIEIEEQKAINEARSKRQQEKLKSLEKLQEQATAQTQEDQTYLNLLDSKLNNMIQGVSHLFKTCKCNSDPLMALLDDNLTVQPYNVLLHLQILEKKVHESLIKASVKDKIMTIKKGATQREKVISTEPIKTQVFPIEKIVATNPCALCVEFEMVGDVIDNLQTVWNRQEVKEKLKQRLELPDGHIRLHNISRCHLPKARHIMQKMYE